MSSIRGKRIVMTLMYMLIRAINRAEWRSD